MTDDELQSLPHGLQIKIKQYYEGMKSAERCVVDYIAKHSKEIQTNTIRELSLKAGSSEATISRLARKLGFDGYTGLRNSFSDRMVDERGLGLECIKRTDDVHMVIRKVFLATRDSIMDTLNLMGGPDYKRALAALANAGKIVFCGLGASAPAANEACKRFLRIGEDCHNSEDADTQLLLASHLRKGDVFVAISHTGRTSTVLEAMKRARKALATVILITNFPASPLAKQADAVLATASFSNDIAEEVLSRRVAELCIIESLYVNCFLMKGNSAMEKLSISNEIASVYKV